MNNFTHALGDKVTLVESDESGTVVGRAEYTVSATSYLIRYRAADGRQTEAWWDDAALKAA